MNIFEVLFWISLAIIFYSYLGYGILLFIIIRVRRIFGFSKNHAGQVHYEPEVTLFVAAYNEKEFIDQKVQNSLSLNYPGEKLKHVWVTDGSNDGTPDFLKSYKNIEVYHIDQRGGKIGAMNRGMQFVKTPIVVFSDGNTILGKDSIREIVRLFSDPQVGCVSGEKRIFNKKSDAAAGSGEGLYWKYESMLKKWDAELYSVVGAAGELFAIRTNLWQEIEPDTLLDDFIISLRIAMAGYTIQYSPEAYAIETASANVGEELKRKIRISAGGIQSVIRLRSLLNIFRYGVLTFQYVSHRVLRWTVTPLLLLLILLMNLAIAVHYGMLITNIYVIMFYVQMLFYIAALAGWFLENRSIKVKVLFVPYYFFIMNLSVYLGFIRFLRGRQTVNWERAQRAKH